MPKILWCVTNALAYHRIITNQSICKFYRIATCDGEYNKVDDWFDTETLLALGGVQ